MTQTYRNPQPQPLSPNSQNLPPNPNPTQTPPDPKFLPSNLSPIENLINANNIGQQVYVPGTEGSRLGSGISNSGNRWDEYMVGGAEGKGQVRDVREGYIVEGAEFGENGHGREEYGGGFAEGSVLQPRNTNVMPMQSQFPQKTSQLQNIPPPQTQPPFDAQCPPQQQYPQSQSQLQPQQTNTQLNTSPQPHNNHLYPNIVPSIDNSPNLNQLLPDYGTASEAAMHRVEEKVTNLPSGSSNQPMDVQNIGGQIKGNMMAMHNQGMGNQGLMMQPNIGSNQPNQGNLTSNQGNLWPTHPEIVTPVNQLPPPSINMPRQPETAYNPVQNLPIPPQPGQQADRFTFGGSPTPEISLASLQQQQPTLATPSGRDNIVYQAEQSLYSRDGRPEAPGNSQLEYTYGEMYNWTNPHGRKIPLVPFHKDCHKCHGQGAAPKRFSKAILPCSACYEREGYCKKCYGSGTDYMSDRPCKRCQGHCYLLHRNKIERGGRGSSSSSGKENQ